VKKEAGSRSELGSIGLFEGPEAFFIKNGAGKLETEAVKFLWKQKHFEEKG